MRNRCLTAVFFYAIAANIPFWIASQVFGLELKGWFNLEFVLIGILSLYLRRRIILALLVVGILVDILSGISSTYRLSISDIFRSTGSLFAIVPSRIGGILIVLIGLVVICLVMEAATPNSYATGRERMAIISALVIFTCVSGVIDAETGHISSFKLDRQLGTIRLARVPTYTLYRLSLERRAIGRVTATEMDASAPAASMKMVEFSSRPEQSASMEPNLVLILVESWGKPVASDLNELLLRPYSNQGLSKRYTFSQGTVPFHGGTVSGEARELCGSEMGFGLLTASASRLKTCLPAKLNAMGYHSLGVHGFSAKMFDRGEWYRRIGFEEVAFGDQMKLQGLPLCPGPFPGICDSAISSWIGNRLQESTDAPQFVYWVTLNSHLPVPVPNRVDAPPSCSQLKEVAQSQALCSWYQLVFNVHRSVTELALRKTARPTAFFIVGDHAPPFASSALREQFSGEVVPYVMLEPKTSRALIAGSPLDEGSGVASKRVKRDKALSM